MVICFKEKGENVAELCNYVHQDSQSINQLFQTAAEIVVHVSFRSGRLLLTQQ